MVTLLLILTLVGLILVSIGLQKTYGLLPIKELKRRAQAGDEAAKLLFRGAAYGATLRLFLWLLIGFSAAALVVLVRHVTVSAWVLLSVVPIVIWVCFAWLPTSSLSRFSAQMTLWFTPAIVWLLHYLYPLLAFVVTVLRRLRTAQTHTGLYQKEDLVELIKRQQHQADNRMTLIEFQMAVNSLTFGDKLIREYLTPRSVVKSVNITESIGPVLMGELHSSGHSRFPVFKDKQDNIVGTLFLHDLVDIHAAGRVRDIMKKDVYYIHEEQVLHDALRLMLKTNHHLLIVVNDFEEFVGIITLDNILEQILGRPVYDEFDKHDNLRAVAKRAAQKQHSQHQENTSPETTEVVE